MPAYYNEIDSKAAAWLRELIKQGHIAPGEVDERSIEDVIPSELAGFTQCHFFAGIGVWSYALRQAGWSDDQPVWTGSCPCQPFSAAGKGKGITDERHLWPALYHLIRQCKPDVVFGEQVASKDGLGWLDIVQTDLEAARYSVGAVDLCAAGFGAPHIRQRLYWVADASSSRRQSFSDIQSASVQREAVQSTELIVKLGYNGAVFDGMADFSGKGLQGRLLGRESTRRENQHRHVGCDGTADGMADAASDRRREGQSQPGGGASGDGAEGAIRRTAQFGVAGGMVYTSSVRQCGRFEDETRQQSEVSGAGCESVFAGKPAASPVNGFWGDADWLLCRDGKWRAVEPGTFPLVNGAPARVGRLRGYGNAIVAQVAQAFIEAYLDLEV